MSLIALKLVFAGILKEPKLVASKFAPTGLRQIGPVDFVTGNTSALVSIPNDSAPDVSTLAQT